MSTSLQPIPIVNLAISFIPALVALIILIKWSLEAKNACYAIVRMLVQLLLIGYVLTYIFESDSATIILAVLCIMVVASSWIALGTVKQHRAPLFICAFSAILLGGGMTLWLVSQGVLDLQPWYMPQYLIPLAGMIFANSMTSISLAAERIYAEMSRGVDYPEARNIAMQAAMIPVINALFAVGLVSLPGMMTGQILSGVSPLVASRYQIMVMCMIFGSAGISAACFLSWGRTVFETKR